MNLIHSLDASLFDRVKEFWTFKHQGSTIYYFKIEQAVEFDVFKNNPW